MLRRLLILGLVVGLAGAGCASSPSPRQAREAKIEVRAGHYVPGYGFSIDARYDPRLDNLIPGYKLLTVVVRNTSLQVIPMEAGKDRWTLTGFDGKRYRAANSLRLKDRKLWRTIPAKVQELVDYPEVVPISYTVTFDLLFSPSDDLKDFLELRFFNATWGQEITVLKE